MTRRHLVMCTACARHFRVNEPACPFCGAELPASLRESAVPQGPSVRLSRAALLAFNTLGTGAFAAIAGCGGDVAKDNMSVSAPPYGLSPMPDASDQVYDASTTTGIAVPYGIPPLADAGIAADDSSFIGAVGEAGDESDSGHAGAADARASEAPDATADAEASDAEASEDSEAPDARVFIAPPYGLAPVPPQ